MMLKKILIGALAALSVTGAMAAPLTFTVNQTISQKAATLTFFETDYRYALLPTGQYLVLDPGTADNELDVGLWNKLEEDLDTNKRAGNFGVTDAANTLQRFAAGNVVGALTLGTSTNLDPYAYALLDTAPTTGWDVLILSAYLGFKTLDNHYGYVAADWTYDPTTKIATLTLGDGAVESVADTAITIPGGTVPEPATLSLLGLGLLGAGLARRRKN